MGQRDEENQNPASEDEADAEKQKLRPNPPEEMEMKKIPIQTRDKEYPIVIGGPEEPLIKSSHLKYVLLGFNFFLSLLGIALLSVTIWILADPEFWQYETTLNVDNFYTVCAMSIVVGLVILLIGVLGCMGAASERRWMLIVYMLFFGLIFGIQLAAVAIMWSAPYSSTIKSELEKQIQKQIDQSEDDDAARFFVDFIQEKLCCCGSKNVYDYKGKLSPPSCQDPLDGTVFTEGCANKMLVYLRTKAGIVGGIALPILFIQLLALVASGCLIKSLDIESKYLMRS